ncbi:N-acetyltransferase family protein [Shewanella profunda]|uniref:arsinothricin resistance N-acetyltransferase ArsN1 family B n=1 Tax=Shewanella profunda TaxID=254793 RepID=UPI00200CC9F2|nr:arsinothricin resistance N-acetyltransferase ArsN1 family B [Shewanella profunda]MCL1090287.1 N-acetyltransferase family protein [Shewanella profunda]
MIRQVKKEDAYNIAKIYNYYIENTSVTFELKPVSTPEMEQRIEDACNSELPWLVAENNGHIIGYCYASKWKGRCAYRYSVEVTVYLDFSITSQGWGTMLYEQLLTQLKSLQVHAVIGGIALPNEASVALHEKFGMKKVAHFKEVGRKFENWVDVGYWQCILNA